MPVFLAIKEHLLEEKYSHSIKRKNEKTPGAAQGTILIRSSNK